MTIWICKTCGAHHPESMQPRAHCPICEDERQYVGANGQEWLDRAAITASHHNDWREIEPGLTGIGLSPTIAIGQRALLIQTPDGNVLWDCTPMLDDVTASRIRSLGGLKAIVFSHPHFTPAWWNGARLWAACRFYCPRRTCRMSCGRAR